MLHRQTKVKIVDNTGGKLGNCLTTYKKRSGQIGDIILLSIRKIKAQSKQRIKLSKGDMYKALVVRTKVLTSNFSNTSIKFDQNAVILLKNDKPLGSRIFGPVPLKLRKNKNFKIIMLANILI